MKKEIKNQIIIYENENGKPNVEVFFENQNIWLSQDQIAQLFGVQRPAITKHIGNIIKEGELDEKSVSSILEHTANDNKVYKTKFYNLDMIISIGYRVNSQTATKFRIWATDKLKEYITKGFVLNDEKLKGNGGGNYWKELLERIRDIRSSEKVIYRQVLELYATSIDYDPKSEETIKFFKIVQNKIHYAVNKLTASETIYNRVDAEKDFLGLTTFNSRTPTIKDVIIAKNYLNEDELFRLNRIVSAFFDLAEIKAKEQEKMTMKDWIKELDIFSQNYGKGILKDAGKISNEKAINKAKAEYKKYQLKTLSPVEKEYLDVITLIEKKVNKKKLK